jgi:hypothetical protein
MAIRGRQADCDVFGCKDVLRERPFLV